MPLCTPLDKDAASTLAATYASGASSLTVAAGTGPRFGSPSPSAPIRVTIIAASALDDAGRLTPPTAAYCTFKCTGRTGDVLSGLTLEKGTAQGFAVGDIVASLFTEDTVQDVHDALALRATLASPALTGTPTAPTATVGTNTTQVATTAFVLANAGSGGSGTVTTVSASVPSGFSVAVTNATTTPAVAITTTLSGVLKGTGSGFAAATAGTDYLTPTGNGSGLTALNASALASGTVATARLGTGTADNTTYLRGDGSWATPSGGGSGTVTSVALSTPGVLFSVAGSPVTTSGTLALSLVTQTANTVFAGPTTGSAATPTMRALVAADLPAHSATLLTSGTVATARLGSGTADSTTYLRGDGTWATPAGGGGGGSIASTSLVLKGDGAGAAVAATAGTDYVKASGVSGGQTAYGGTAASNGLTLKGTSHATPGPVYFNSVASDLKRLSVDANTNLVVFNDNNGNAVTLTVYASPYYGAIESSVNLVLSAGFGGLLQIGDAGQNSIRFGNSGLAWGGCGYWHGGASRLHVGSGSDGSAQLHVSVTDDAARPALITEGIASQTGAHHLFRGTSSTTAGRDMAVVDTYWQTSTDASRKGGVKELYADSSSGTYPTGWKEARRGWSDGTNARHATTAPASAPADADLGISQISFFLDESGNNLKVRVKYADGTTLKTGTIALV